MSKCIDCLYAGSSQRALDEIRAIADFPGDGSTDHADALGRLERIYQLAKHQGSDGEESRRLPVGGAQSTQAGSDSGGMPLSVGRSRPDQTATSFQGGIPCAERDSYCVRQACRMRDTCMAREEREAGGRASPVLAVGTAEAYIPGLKGGLAIDLDAAARFASNAIYEAVMALNLVGNQSVIAKLADAKQMLDATLAANPVSSQVRGSDAEAIQAFKDRFPAPPNPQAQTMKESPLICSKCQHHPWRAAEGDTCYFKGECDGTYRRIAQVTGNGGDRG